MRVGLIGVGRVAESAHIPAWLNIPGVDLTAMADPSPERRALAPMLAPKARIYASGDEMLARENLDIVDVCSAPDSHADYIIAACARGIDRIVCEKPLTVSESEFARIAFAQATTSTRIVTVNTWIHSDLHALVHETITSGVIGAVKSVTLRTLRPDCALGTESWRPRWRTEKHSAGGGIILDHGWHQLYLMLSWLGTDVQAVSAQTRTTNPIHLPVEDEAEIDVVFPTSRGRIELSWAADERGNDGLIEGTTGRILIQDNGILIEQEAGPVERVYNSRLSASTYHPDWFETMFREVVLAPDRTGADRNFVEAGLLTGTLAAAYRSAENAGLPVRVVAPVRRASSHQHSAVSTQQSAVSNSPLAAGDPLAAGGIFPAAE